MHRLPLPVYFRYACEASRILISDVKSVAGEMGLYVDGTIIKAMRNLNHHGTRAF